MSQGILPFLNKTKLQHLYLFTKQLILQHQEKEICPFLKQKCKNFSENLRKIRPANIFQVQFIEIQSIYDKKHLSAVLVLHFYEKKKTKKKKTTRQNVEKSGKIFLYAI